MAAPYGNSRALYEASKQYLAGGVSSNFRYAGYGESPVPLFYANGAGARLTDVDGNTYIDYAFANGPFDGHYHGRTLLNRGLGTVFHPAFTEREAIKDYAFLETEGQARARFDAKLHTDADIDQTLDAVQHAFTEMEDLG